MTNKKKIVILGGLGYIGTEISKLFTNSSDEILVIDSNYIESQVKWLENNGIKYYQRDIFNLSDLISDADICINLISITKVPQTQAQSNPIIDSEITWIGTEGTRYVLNNLPDKCLVIFTSSHVVFESLPPNSPAVTEKTSVCPNLAYSTSKANSEKDIVSSGKDYLILRLASIYGWSENIRWSILPNLFSRRAAFNENLNIFGVGSQIKPLASVHDLCRFIQWSLENNYKNEIVQFVNEHKTVKEIGEICARLNPEISINHTNDETPNDGYYVSNEKLLKLGFKFEKTIEGEIADMIFRWRNS